MKIYVDLTAPPTHDPLGEQSELTQKAEMVGARLVDAITR
jgi:hypothetical protein